MHTILVLLASYKILLPFFKLSQKQIQDDDCRLESIYRRNSSIQMKFILSHRITFIYKFITSWRKAFQSTVFLGYHGRFALPPPQTTVAIAELVKQPEA